MFFENRTKNENQNLGQAGKCSCSITFFAILNDLGTLVFEVSQIVRNERMSDFLIEKSFNVESGVPKEISYKKIEQKNLIWSRK